VLPLTTQEIDRAHFGFSLNGRVALECAGTAAERVERGVDYKPQHPETSRRTSIAYLESSRTRWKNGYMLTLGQFEYFEQLAFQRSIL
jgi:hypothetical protein